MIVWSAERLAIVRQLYPTYATDAEIRARLNACKGPEITSSGLRSKTHRMGLKRPADFRAIVHVNVWPDERLAILRRDWPTDRPRAEIIASVNAIAGPPVTDAAVGRKAHAIGLRRPEFHRVAMSCRNLLKGWSCNGRPKFWEPDVCAAVREGYDKGRSLIQISDHIYRLTRIRVTPRAIQTQASKMGLKRPDWFKSKAKREGHKAAKAARRGFVPVVIAKPAPKPVAVPVAYAANAVTRAVKSGKTFSMLRG